MQTKTRIAHKKSGIKMSDVMIIKNKPKKQTTAKEKKS